MKVISTLSWTSRLLLLLSLALAALPLWPAGRQVLFLDNPQPVTIQKGGSATVHLQARLLDGYHVNSHQPADKYLIPLKLTWQASPLSVDGIHFPEPEMKRYSFSDKPLSVFASDFNIETGFRAPADAPTGRRTINGSLRYQACSDNLCLPPKTIGVELVVEIR